LASDCSARRGTDVASYDLQAFFCSRLRQGNGVLAAWDRHPAPARVILEEKPTDYPYTHELTVQAASLLASGLPSDA